MEVFAFVAIAFAKACSASGRGEFPTIGANQIVATEQGRQFNFQRPRKARSDKFPIPTIRPLHDVTRGQLNCRVTDMFETDVHIRIVRQRAPTAQIL